MSVSHLVQLSSPTPSPPYPLDLPMTLWSCTRLKETPCSPTCHLGSCPESIPLTLISNLSYYLSRPLILIHTSSSKYTVFTSCPDHLPFYALPQSLQVSKSTFLPTLSGLLPQKCSFQWDDFQFTFSDLASCPFPWFLRTSQNLMVASFSKWCCFPLSKNYILWLVPSSVYLALSELIGSTRFPIWHTCLAHW